MRNRFGLRRFRNQTHRSAFTLPELMVASAVGILVILALGSFYRGSLSAIGGLDTENTIGRDGRRTIDQLASELRRARSVAISSASQITLELPVFQSGSSCSAHVMTAGTVTPVTCTSDGDCINLCGAGSCGNGICHKRYTYSLTDLGNGVSQLQASADDGDEGAARILGNHIQNIAFQSAATDPNLGANEYRIQLTAQQTSKFEKRLRQANYQAVVHARNS